ncbi:MAG: hypothetical protein ACKV2V_28045 [Blastocatellia bacterium]
MSFAVFRPGAVRGAAVYFFRRCFISRNPAVHSLLVTAVFLLMPALLVKPASAAPIVTVSAASYDANAMSPECIVSGFGVSLAAQDAGGFDTDPNTPGIQLPTELAGRSVEVNGQKAGLLYVSPGQINYVIPANVAPGMATVQVRAGNAVIADGVIRIYQAAPGIFTANSSGAGAPAGFAIRVQGIRQSFLAVTQFDPVSQSLIPLPIDLGPAARPGEEQEIVVLVFFLSGIRYAPDPNRDGNVSESVRIILGGVEITPDYAGRQGDFVGLDQINVTIPRSLTGVGRISLSVVATAGTTGQPSKPVELEIADAPGAVNISGYGSPSALAGNTLSISGSGFSTRAEENNVSIIGAEGQSRATVVEALPNRLTVLVPFGVESGKTRVQTPAGSTVSQNLIAVRTSFSGFFKDTTGQKLRGVAINITDSAGKKNAAKTSEEGSFVIPDMAAGPMIVEVDGLSVGASPPFPKITLKKIIRANRDNQMDFPGALQQLTGTSTPVSPPAGSAAEVDGKTDFHSLIIAAPASPDEVTGSIQSGNVRLDIPDGAVIRNPDGSPAGPLSLTLVNRSLTPVALPPAQYSSVIALIAPVGAMITPGARLRFPNPDALPAGTPVTLFRLDQNRDSDTLGQFIEAGPATISANGQEILTAPGAITEATYYFISTPRQMVTLVGRVTTPMRVPARRAIVDSRGQSIFTDGNGGFVVRNVPVNAVATGPAGQPQRIVMVEGSQAVIAGEMVDVQANYMWPTAIVDRSDSRAVAPVIGGATNVQDLVLLANRLNQPPVITAPNSLNVNAGQTQNFEFIVTDPDPGQTLRVSATGVAFATVVAGTSDVYILRIVTGAGDAGTYSVIVTAVDSLGGITSKNIALTVR